MASFCPAREFSRHAVAGELLVQKRLLPRRSKAPEKKRRENVLGIKGKLPDAASNVFKRPTLMSMVL